MTKYDFLKGFTPKNEHYTTNEEVELVTEALGLEGNNERGISFIRDYVVMTYSDLMKEVEDDTEKRWSYSVAMMSVTSVVDHYRYTHNMSV